MRRLQRARRLIRRALNLVLPVSRRQACLLNNHLARPGFPVSHLPVECLPVECLPAECLPAECLPVLPASRQQVHPECLLRARA